MASIAHGDPCVNGSRVRANRSADDRLAAANARLLARRAQLSVRSTTETHEMPSADILPPHLNWGVAGLLGEPSPPTPLAEGEESKLLNGLSSPSSLRERGSGGEGSSSPPQQNLLLQPDLLTAMLREEKVAIGRIYLLCRHLDTNGRGWLAIDDLRTQLTGKHSPLRVCGWRRLRQILQAGKGTFWQRDHFGRLWLYSLTRVAATLGVHRFSNDPVEMPLHILCGNIGALRSAFYAAFHAGRDASPIARATLRDITGVPERTQRHYDAQQQVERTANYTLTEASAPETYFVKQRAAFAFTDKNGSHGQAGAKYIAIRLPNSYHTTRIVRHSKKQTRLNKRLRQDLVKYGTRGNSSGLGERVYFTDGQQAARCIGRSDIFLRDQQRGKAVFWIGWGRK